MTMAHGADIPGLSDDDVRDIATVVDSENLTIVGLIETGILDPKKDFQFGNFCGMPLQGQDLRGIDFTGADLRGTGIEQAILDETTILTDAILDGPVAIPRARAEVVQSDAPSTNNEQPVRETLPRHVAIIMDGNGRWALARGLPRVEGYRRGVEALRRTVRAATDLGIEVLSVFAFSDADWSRPESEVRDLMSLLRRFVRNDLAELHSNNVRVWFIGDRDDLDVEVGRLIEEAEQLTKGNDKLTLVIAFNYSGRREIVRAVERSMASSRSEAVSIDAIRQNLDTAALPEPDLIIRTSGVLRLDDFLLWQSAHSELVFSPLYWPDFDRATFEAALEEFGRRERYTSNNATPPKETPESPRTR